MSDTPFNDSLIEPFSCPVCFEYMDKKIYICLNGHSVCGVCNKQLLRCPVCMVKGNNKRNISLENAAKKVLEWKAKQEVVSVGTMTRKRKQRYSLGSPIKTKLEANIFADSLIQCPHSKCCFFTKHLLQLKTHLLAWHSKEVYMIKKCPVVKSENLMALRLYWGLFEVHRMFVVAISESIFIVYIVRVPCPSCPVNECSYDVNVLTVSNGTNMYKFSCGASSKFSMFYQGKHQAQEGLAVDNSTVENVLRHGTSMKFLKILITKVASLHNENKD